MFLTHPTHKQEIAFVATAAYICRPGKEAKRCPRKTHTEADDLTPKVYPERALVIVINATNGGTNKLAAGTTNTVSLLSFRGHHLGMMRCECARTWYQRQLMPHAIVQPSVLPSEYSLVPPLRLVERLKQKSHIPRKHCLSQASYGSTGTVSWMMVD